MEDDRGAFAAEPEEDFGPAPAGGFGPGSVLADPEISYIRDENLHARGVEGAMQRGVKGIGFFATIYYEVGGTVYCKSLGKNIQFREKELHGEAKKKHEKREKRREKDSRRGKKGEEGKSEVPKSGDSYDDPTQHPDQTFWTNPGNLNVMQRIREEIEGEGRIIRIETDCNLLPCEKKEKGPNACRVSVPQLIEQNFPRSRGEYGIHFFAHDEPGRRVLRGTSHTLDWGAVPSEPWVWDNTPEATYVKEQIREFGPSEIRGEVIAFLDTVVNPVERELQALEQEVGNLVDSYTYGLISWEKTKEALIEIEKRRSFIEEKSSRLPVDIEQFLRRSDIQGELKGNMPESLNRVYEHGVHREKRIARLSGENITPLCQQRRLDYLREQCAAFSDLSAVSKQEIRGVQSRINGIISDIDSFRGRTAAAVQIELREQKGRINQYEERASFLDTQLEEVATTIGAEGKARALGLRDEVRRRRIDLEGQSQAIDRRIDNVYGTWQVKQNQRLQGKFEAIGQLHRENTSLYESVTRQLQGIIDEQEHHPDPSKIAQTMRHLGPLRDGLLRGVGQELKDLERLRRELPTQPEFQGLRDYIGGRMTELEEHNAHIRELSGQIDRLSAPKVDPKAKHGGQPGPGGGSGPGLGLGLGKKR